MARTVTLLNSPGPQQLSRASSSLSLASSVTEDVRHFSSNYEQLLREATASIRRLGRDKAALEAEQDRLLTVNLELAAEVKRLLQLDRDNKEERKVREGEVSQRPGRGQAETRQKPGRGQAEARQRPGRGQAGTQAPDAQIISPPIISTYILVTHAATGALLFNMVNWVPFTSNHLISKQEMPNIKITSVES